MSYSSSADGDLNAFFTDATVQKAYKAHLSTMASHVNSITNVVRTACASACASCLSTRGWHPSGLTGPLLARSKGAQIESYTCSPDGRMHPSG